MKKYNDFIKEQSVSSDIIETELDTATETATETVPETVPETKIIPKINVKKYKELLNKLTHFWSSLKISLGGFGHLSNTFLSSDGNEIERNKNTVREHNNKIRKIRGNKPKTVYVKTLDDDYFYKILSTDDNNYTAKLWNLDIPKGQDNVSVKVVGWDKIKDIVDNDEFAIATKKEKSIKQTNITKPEEGSYCKIESNNNVFYKVLKSDIGNKSAELISLDKKSRINVKWEEIIMLETRELNAIKKKIKNVDVN